MTAPLHPAPHPRPRIVGEIKDKFLAALEGTDSAAFRLRALRGAVARP